MPPVHPNATLRAGDSVWRASDFAAPPASGGLDENTAAALEFCHRWARGDASFLLTTSGTTGTPKHVQLTRNQMVASAFATAEALGLRAGHSCLICLPTRFVAGRMMLVRALVLGLDATLVEPASDPFAGLPPDVTFDFASFVPLQISTLLAGPPDRRAALDRMSAILVGGGPVAPSLAAGIAGMSAPTFHTYAMTETATHVALARLNGPTASPFFVPLPGVETRLDARACLAVRGPMTNGAWIQTNDLVERRPDGSFRWLGRIDLVVNSGGVKVPVEPLEEEVAALLPGLVEELVPRRLLVTGVPDERLGQRLLLVLEGPELDESIRDRILSGLRERLGPYRTPRLLATTPLFFETPTGKIDRPATFAALRDL